MDPFLGAGCGPPMQAFFRENVCENERIGSEGGGGVHRKILYTCRSANGNVLNI